MVSPRDHIKTLLAGGMSIEDIASIITKNHDTIGSTKSSAKALNKRLKRIQDTEIDPINIDSNLKDHAELHANLMHTTDIIDPKFIESEMKRRNLPINMSDVLDEGVRLAMKPFIYKTRANTVKDISDEELKQYGIFPGKMNTLSAVHPLVKNASRGLGNRGIHIIPSALFGEKRRHESFSRLKMEELRNGGNVGRLIRAKGGLNTVKYGRVVDQEFLKELYKGSQKFNNIAVPMFHSYAHRKAIGHQSRKYINSISASNKVRERIWRRSERELETSKEYIRQNYSMDSNSSRGMDMTLSNLSGYPRLDPTSFRPSGYVLGVSPQGRVTGATRFTPDLNNATGEFYVDYLGTNAASYSSGTGTAMLDRMYNEAIRLKSVNIGLHSIADRFYQKYGFIGPSGHMTLGVHDIPKPWDVHNVNINDSAREKLEALARIKGLTTDDIMRMANGDSGHFIATDATGYNIGSMGYDFNRTGDKVKLQHPDLMFQDTGILEMLANTATKSFINQPDISSIFIKNLSGLHSKNITSFTNVDYVHYPQRDLISLKLEDERKRRQRNRVRYDVPDTAFHSAGLYNQGGLVRAADGWVNPALRNVSVDAVTRLKKMQIKVRQEQSAKRIQEMRRQVQKQKLEDLRIASLDRVRSLQESREMINFQPYTQHGIQFGGNPLLSELGNLDTTLSSKLRKIRPDLLDRINVRRPWLQNEQSRVPGIRGPGSNAHRLWGTIGMGIGEFIDAVNPKQEYQYMKDFAPHANIPKIEDIVPNNLNFDSFKSSDIPHDELLRGMHLSRTPEGISSLISKNSLKYLVNQFRSPADDQSDLIAKMGEYKTFNDKATVNIDKTNDFMNLGAGIAGSRWNRPKYASGGIVKAMGGLRHPALQSRVDGSVARLMELRQRAHKQVNPALGNELFNPNNVIVTPNFRFPGASEDSQFSPQYYRYLKSMVPGVFNDMKQEYKNLAVSPYHQTLVVPANRAYDYNPAMLGDVNPNFHDGMFTPDISDKLRMNVIGLNEEKIQDSAWDSSLRHSGLENWHDIALSNHTKSALRHEMTHALVTGPLTTKIPQELFDPLYVNGLNPRLKPDINEEILAEAGFRFKSGSYHDISKKVQSTNLATIANTKGVGPESENDWKSLIKKIRTIAKTPIGYGEASEYLRKYPTLTSKPAYSIPAHALGGLVKAEKGLNTKNHDVNIKNLIGISPDIREGLHLREEYRDLIAERFPGPLKKFINPSDMIDLDVDPRTPRDESYFIKRMKQGSNEVTGKGILLGIAPSAGKRNEFEMSDIAVHEAIHGLAWDNIHKHLTEQGITPGQLIEMIGQNDLTNRAQKEFLQSYDLGYSTAETNERVLDEHIASLMSGYSPDLGTWHDNVLYSPNSFNIDKKSLLKNKKILSKALGIRIPTANEGLNLTRVPFNRDDYKLNFDRESVIGDFIDQSFLKMHGYDTYPGVGMLGEALDDMYQEGLSGTIYDIGGLPVGAESSYKRPGYYHLSRLGVSDHPDYNYQGKGLGKNLFNFAREKAAALQMPMKWSALANNHTVEFYKRQKGVKQLSNYEFSLPFVQRAMGGVGGIDALISNGELTASSTFLKSIGNGNAQMGAGILDAMREDSRGDRRITPNEKSFGFLQNFSNGGGSGLRKIVGPGGITDDRIYAKLKVNGTNDDQAYIIPGFLKDAMAHAGKPFSHNGTFTGKGFASGGSLIGTDMPSFMYGGLIPMSSNSNAMVSVASGFTGLSTLTKTLIQTNSIINKLNTILQKQQASSGTGGSGGGGMPPPPPPTGNVINANHHIRPQDPAMYRGEVTRLDNASGKHIINTFDPYNQFPDVMDFQATPGYQNQGYLSKKRQGYLQGWKNLTHRTGEFVDRFWHPGKGTEHTNATNFETTIGGEYEIDALKRLTDKDYETLLETGVMPGGVTADPRLESYLKNLKMVEGLDEKLKDFAEQIFGHKEARNWVGTNVSKEMRDVEVYDYTDPNTGNDVTHTEKREFANVSAEIRATDQQLSEMGKTSDEVKVQFEQFIKNTLQGTQSTNPSFQNLQRNVEGVRREFTGLWKTGNMFKDISWRMASLSMSAMGVYFSIQGVVMMLQQGFGALITPLSDVDKLFESIGISNAFAPELIKASSIMDNLEVSTNDMLNAWKNVSGLQASWNAGLAAFGAQLFDEETTNNIAAAFSKLFTSLNESGNIEKMQSFFETLITALPPVISGLNAFVDVIKWIAEQDTFGEGWLISLSSYALILSLFAQPITAFGASIGTIIGAGIKAGAVIVGLAQAGQLGTATFAKFTSVMVGFGTSMAFLLKWGIILDAIVLSLNSLLEVLGNDFRLPSIVGQLTGVNTFQDAGRAIGLFSKGNVFEDGIVQGERQGIDSVPALTPSGPALIAPGEAILPADLVDIYGEQNVSDFIKTNDVNELTNNRKSNGGVYNNGGGYLSSDNNILSLRQISTTNDRFMGDISRFTGESSDYLNASFDGGAFHVIVDNGFGNGGEGEEGRSRDVGDDNPLADMLQYAAAGLKPIKLGDAFKPVIDGFKTLVKKIPLPDIKLDVIKFLPDSIGKFFSDLLSKIRSVLDGSKIKSTIEDIKVIISDFFSKIKENISKLTVDKWVEKTNQKYGQETKPSPDNIEKLTNDWREKQARAEKLDPDGSKYIDDNGKVQYTSRAYQSASEALQKLQEAQTKTFVPEIKPEPRSLVPVPDSDIIFNSDTYKGGQIPDYNTLGIEEADYSVKSESLEGYEKMMPDTEGKTKGSFFSKMSKVFGDGFKSLPKNALDLWSGQGGYNVKEGMKPTDPLTMMAAATVGMEHGFDSPEFMAAMGNMTVMGGAWLGASGAAMKAEAPIAARGLAMMNAPGATTMSKLGGIGLTKVGEGLGAMGKLMGPLAGQAMKVALPVTGATEIFNAGTMIKEGMSPAEMREQEKVQDLLSFGLFRHITSYGVEANQEEALQHAETAKNIDAMVYNMKGNDPLSSAAIQTFQKIYDKPLQAMFTMNPITGAGINAMNQGLDFVGEHFKPMKGVTQYMRDVADDLTGANMTDILLGSEYFVKGLVPSAQKLGGAVLEFDPGQAFESMKMVGGGFLESIGIGGGNKSVGGGKWDNITALSNDELSQMAAVFQTMNMMEAMSNESNIYQTTELLNRMSPGNVENMSGIIPEERSQTGEISANKQFNVQVGDVILQVDTNGKSVEDALKDPELIDQISRSVVQAMGGYTVY